MIDYNYLASMTETVGMPIIGGKSLFSVYQIHKTPTQFITKDMIFFDDIKLKKIAQETVNFSIKIRPFEKQGRNAKINAIMKSVNQYYGFKMFGVTMSGKCYSTTLSKEMKEYICEKWKELQPNYVYMSKGWWSAFSRTLQTKKTTRIAKNTILKKLAEYNK
ncbi:hypothetical protein [Komagataeibacter nataicola]|uniref:hypothetical protein n=1 Tax=Komagataeibacter nataicola TaxID=265960 RepID=UPI0011B46189|nr:hypothetical protein [Komagataeibacter nataicola]WNM08135.1 hypothetical protein RI056_14650 [Komagataeibacter nataicola]GBR19685.1 hypothetical protein AA0616_1603 [Komagataeibacter nataicola NRIC 0616]